MEKNFNQVTHDGHVKYDDEKVRDHCDITGIYRGAAYWSCDLYLKLTKRFL